MYIIILLFIQTLNYINNISCTGCIKNKIYFCDICNYNNTIYKTSECLLCYNTYPCKLDTNCYNCYNCSYN